MKKTSSKLFVVPYMLWIALFVLAPLVLIFGQSFFNIEGQFSLENYKSYFASQNLTYLKMSFNSVLYAGIVTFVTLLISYPTALFLTRLKHRQLWLMLIILPTWINLLLKAYAFINFMLKPENALQNAEYVGYSTPNLPAKELLPEETKEDKAFYPDVETMKHLEVYEKFDHKWTGKYSDLFLQFKMYRK